jgi:hypothetical protein
MYVAGWLAGWLARGFDSQEETRRFSTAVGATERARLRGHAAKLRCALLHHQKLVLRFLMSNHTTVMLSLSEVAMLTNDLSGRFDFYNLQRAGAGQAGRRF